MSGEEHPVEEDKLICMTRREVVAVLLYLPLHFFLLPTLLMWLPETSGLTELQMNVVIYTLGTVWMLIFAGRFLRRDFDPFCDHPSFCILQVLIGYGMIMALNMLIAAFLQLLQPALSNPNNATWEAEMATDFGKVSALAVFLAPLVEEPIFRGGIFGLLYERSRFAAYLVSMLLFSLAHVLGYAIADPVYWIYLLQYLPASWMLCRTYERCRSIWGSILLHMMINGISVLTIQALQKMM